MITTMTTQSYNLYKLRHDAMEDIDPVTAVEVIKILDLWYDGWMPEVTAINKLVKLGVLKVEDNEER